MMANTMKLLILSACSIALSCAEVIGKDADHDLTPNEAHEPISARYQTPSISRTKHTSDLSIAASSLSVQPNRYAQLPAALNTQPSIYHSIIDRSPAASQPASPIQATSSTTGDLHTAAGHHHGHAHGKYYEYREVPKKKTWKFAYKRGNHKHTISRHEHGKAGKHPHFKTKVKWHDKKSKGKGIHLWDYNHHDKKHYHHG